MCHNIECKCNIIRRVQSVTYLHVNFSMGICSAWLACVYEDACTHMCLRLLSIKRLEFNIKLKVDVCFPIWTNGTTSFAKQRDEYDTWAEGHRLVFVLPDPTPGGGDTSLACPNICLYDVFLCV